MRTSFHLLLRIFLAIPLFDYGAAALAQTSNACEAILKDAEEKYIKAEFEQAIVLINTCLSQAGITPKDKIAAHKLLAKAYVARGDRESAKKNFKLILDLDPKFELLPGQERENVIQVFEEAKQEKRVEKLPPPFPEKLPVEKKGGSKKKLLFIGGGGVAVAAIVVAVLVSGGTEEGFPKPPVRP